jgi:hypothetical protein
VGIQRLGQLWIVTRYLPYTASLCPEPHQDSHVDKGTPEKVAEMGLFTRKDSKASLVDLPSGTSTKRTSTASSSAKSARNSVFSKKMPPPMPTNTMPKPPDPSVDPVAYLKSVYAVRERSRLVYEKAQRNQLRHFKVDMSKFPETATYVVSIIKVCDTIEFGRGMLT